MDPEEAHRDRGDDRHRQSDRHQPDHGKVGPLRAQLLTQANLLSHERSVDLRGVYALAKEIDSTMPHYPEEQLKRAEVFYASSVIHEVAKRIFVPRDELITINYAHDSEPQLLRAHILAETWHTKPYLDRFLLQSADIRPIHAHTQLTGISIDNLAFTDIAFSFEEESTFYTWFQDDIFPRNPFQDFLLDYINHTHIDADSFAQEFGVKSARHMQIRYAADNCFAASQSGERRPEQPPHFNTDTLLRPESTLRPLCQQMSVYSARGAYLRNLIKNHSAALHGAIDEIENYHAAGNNDYAAMAFFNFIGTSLMAYDSTDQSDSLLHRLQADSARLLFAGGAEQGLQNPAAWLSAIITNGEFDAVACRKLLQAIYRMDLLDDRERREYL